MARGIGCVEIRARISQRCVWCAKKMAGRVGIRGHFKIFVHASTGRPCTCLAQTHIFHVLCLPLSAKKLQDAAAGNDEEEDDFFLGSSDDGDGEKAGLQSPIPAAAAPRPERAAAAMPMSRKLPAPPLPAAAGSRDNDGDDGEGAHLHGAGGRSSEDNGMGGRGGGGQESVSDEDGEDGNSMESSSQEEDHGFGFDDASSSEDEREKEDKMFEKDGPSLSHQEGQKRGDASPRGFSRAAGGGRLERFAKARGQTSNGRAGAPAKALGGRSSAGRVQMEGRTMQLGGSEEWLPNRDSIPSKALDGPTRSAQKPPQQRKRGGMPAKKAEGKKPLRTRAEGGRKRRK
jgi:hypothetical protein